MPKMYYSYNTQERLRRKFGSHARLYGKADPQFPVTAEREYFRLINQYFRELKLIIEEELPKMKEEYRRQWEEQKGIRTDGVFDMVTFVDRFFGGLVEKATQKLMDMESFGKLIKHLYKIGDITKNTEIREWRRMVKKTLGVDLREDYYSGSFFDELIQQWVSENVDLIKTIPQNTLGRMKKIIQEGYEKGTTTSDIMRSINASYGTEKRHAYFIARDQMAKLNARITQKEHKDAGVIGYKWSDSGDQRVRESHRQLSRRSEAGEIFDYDNPPETDDDRHCNPGEDYQCRCVAIPVFDFENLNLPIKEEETSWSS